MPVEEYFAQLAIAVLVAIISALVTVQLSMHRFRTEKWWERKISAYQNIIEALHHAKLFSAHHLEAGYNFSELSKERDLELRSQAKQAGDEIEKYTDVGSFLLSKAVVARLRQFAKDTKGVQDAHGWVDYLEEHQAAVDRCLRDIIALARENLGQKGNGT